MQSLAAAPDSAEPVNGDKAVETMKEITKTICCKYPDLFMARSRRYGDGSHRSTIDRDDGLKKVEHFEDITRLV
jgi:hypothetical protein